MLFYNLQLCTVLWPFIHDTKSHSARKHGWSWGVIANNYGISCSTCGTFNMGQKFYFFQNFDNSDCPSCYGNFNNWLPMSTIELFTYSFFLKISLSGLQYFLRLLLSLRNPQKHLVFQWTWNLPLSNLCLKKLVWIMMFSRAFDQYLTSRFSLR